MDPACTQRCLLMRAEPENGVLHVRDKFKRLPMKRSRARFRTVSCSCREGPNTHVGVGVWWCGCAATMMQSAFRAVGR